MLLLSDPENEAIFKSLIYDVAQKTGGEVALPDEKAASILAGILEADSAVVVPIQRRTIHRSWMRVAAAVLIVVFAGGFFYLTRSNQHKEPTNVAKIEKAAPILPGSDKAILTMSDGRTIELDNIKNGAFTEAGNAKIQKQGALLIYNLAGAANNGARVEYNTLSTPRGGQYQVVLNDGTKVWLNAASSLRFPTMFTGKEREVELTGEAYFEVAKNKSMPFHVKVNGMQVNVLGTHFNINAYSEEPAMKTSLLEGSVQVVNGSFTNKLKPGEQGIVTHKNSSIDVRIADMDAVMAWKNGLFEFQGADIATIMRQLSRWYDVDIVFAGTAPSRRFEGKISRNAQLADVLKILELSNIKFTVEGKKIIVQ